VYNRVASDEQIFSDPEEAVEFIETIRDAKTRDGWRVLAWCVMSNHHHLLIRTATVPLWREMHRTQKEIGISFHPLRGYHSLGPFNLFPIRPNRLDRGAPRADLDGLRSIGPRPSPHLPTEPPIRAFRPHLSRPRIAHEADSLRERQPVLSSAAPVPPPCAGDASGSRRPHRAR